jgi:hypothetical protein
LVFATPLGLATANVEMRIIAAEPISILIGLTSMFLLLV